MKFEDLFVMKYARFSLLSTLFMTTALSGCSSFTLSPVKAESDTAVMNKQGLYLPETQPGKRYSFSQSPWGENITAKVEEVYASANNRQCLLLAVSGMSVQSSSSNKALVCQVSKDIWEPVRLFSS